MSSDFYSRDEVVERGSIPLDIDNVHMLLQVEQEQIQKKTFTNWVNAQLAKRRPPCMILDLFHDFRDGSRLLDLLEVMSGQRLSRERGRGMFQHRSNIEKGLSFLKAKSIKLVNINIPDIIDGKPSIILGLVWTIILQYHIEELASSLSFSSRQSSMESLASLDSRSTLSSRSAGSSPVPRRGSPLHQRFRVSAKKALLLWVREQCHKAGCTLNVKDFKSSWRSGVVFLAILYALRPDVVDLSKARTRSNKQNLEEAFTVAERELRIPKLLDPDDVDVRDPDEKSIMTYVAQFLQYSKDLPVAEDDVQTQFLTLPKSPSPVSLPVHYTPAVSASPVRQASSDQKVKEVTHWLLQAYDELLEGWDSTEGESYAERFQVFQTFVVSFSEQRRPIIPLLTAMRRSPRLSEEQRALREAWDTLAQKIHEYRMELDTSLPAPLDVVARWLLKTEGALGEEELEPQHHGRAAEEAQEKQELLKGCLEEMPQHLKTFQTFQNTDHYGNMMVPADKLDELKRRFTSIRVSAKYHGIKLEYREHRHAALELLGQIRIKLLVWKRPYTSPEAVRVLLQEWHELVNTQGLPAQLESALHKLKQVSEKYQSKSALAGDYPHVSQQVKQLEEDSSAALSEVTTAKSIMGRVLSAWDSYSDCVSSLQAWLEQTSIRLSHGPRAELTAECVAEWETQKTQLNEAGNFLLELTDPQTSRILEEELRRVNLHWTEFTRTNASGSIPGADTQLTSQDVQALVRQSTLILKEPLEAMAGPLRTYRKRLQFIIRKLEEVDFEALSPSPDCPADHLQKLKLAIPEVLQTLLEAEQVCAELQHSVSGLDWRLAELHFWETEAREVYQQLKTTDRQRRGQDPQARLLISRGLQLEGQVVTEDQDLQEMVMTTQKNSPIQYLHVSTMQDRVRGAVAQSQEVVGMLSSLGARRDRSRSPSEGRPPSKVFIRGDEKSQHQMDSDSRNQSQQVQSGLVSQQPQDRFVPKIVVQEYSEEKMPSSQPIWTQPSTDQEISPQKPQQNQEQQQLVQCPVQEKSETPVQKDPEFCEHPSAQEQGVMKVPLSPQELQSRKSKAMKNRPWLQKPVTEEPKPPDSSQANVQTGQAQPESAAQRVPQQQKQIKQHPGETKGQQIQGEKEPKKKEQKPPLVRSPSDPTTAPPHKRKVPNQSQAKVTAQPTHQAAKPPEVVYSPTEGQQPPKTQVQTHVPAEPQPPPPQGLAPEPVVAHSQIWAQVRPLSPMQASLHGHVQPPAPSHIQLRGHPQSWTPVRSPSPKPPTYSQPPTQTQATTQPQTQVQAEAQAGYSQWFAQKAQPLAAAPHSEPFPQSQMSLTQVRGSASMPVPQPYTKEQPPFYPQGYFQDQPPGQPWTPISQLYPQQIGQAPPRWPQFSPQVGPPGSSVEFPYTQPLTQTEALPRNSTNQQAEMKGYDLFSFQTLPGQVQEQPWLQYQPQAYSHTLLMPQPQRPQQPSPHTQPQVHSTGESPEKIKPSAQLVLEIQSPAQSVVVNSTQPQPVTESFPPQPPAQSPLSPPRQHVPTLPVALPQVTSPPDPQGPIREAEVQVAPSPPIQRQDHMSAQPKAPGQLPTRPEPRPEDHPHLEPPTRSESPDLCVPPLTLSQAPPQAYTEAYAKAQALARNGFEEAKHCLQEHILEAMSIFEDKSLSAEPASLKQETLRTLDPELLEEFLRAAKGMEAFCSPPQLRDMEFYTQCVRTQWEDVRADISAFSQQLLFELKRKRFNSAALQPELHVRSQACISADSSFVEAGQQLQALKELRDTLNPEDAHRLAQTQLRECQTRLADIQRQFSGDQEAPLSDSRVPVVFSESLITEKEPTGSTDTPQTPNEVSPVTVKTVSAEREAQKQLSVEEDVKQREALGRYDTCKKSLQAQLAKNEMSINEASPESVSLNGLHTRLQEIQFLRQETESLWSEYTNQCFQLSGSSDMEQEKVGLQEQWSSQQSTLQRRGSSLGAALRQIDSTENHLVDFSERLDRYLRQPKDIVGFMLINSNILKDIKDLDDNIQCELAQLARLDPDSSDLDPRDCFPLSSEVKAHRTSLDQLRRQVRKSEAAARALDRFLMSLRTLDEDVSGVQAAPCSDAQLLRDCRSKLAVMRQGVDSLKEKAPQLDLLLQGARLTITRDGAPASCLDMVTILLRRLEETDDGLAVQQRTVQKENQSKSLGLRKRTLLGELRKLQDAVEGQSLKEPTIPAVQHRLRAVTDLEGPLQTLQSELRDLRELQDEEGGGENLFEELEAQWKETQKAFSDRKKQCNTLLDLLKKFQSCRGDLSSTMQRAEQVVNEQASYMGKDYLQRSITKVFDIKEGLAGLGEKIEEMRSVCRQLQSELKKLPDCSETSFEAEADALMDNWLDVTEKTDAYMDNLRVGLELWEKQLSLGGEVESWARARLALFAESHPFHNQQHVSDMKEEICKHEENIEHFHKKSVEIQEMLQSQEAPLELQVMGGQLRKRMQQVKELFRDSADVFEELIAVKTHLAEKIEECHSAVENVQSSLNEVDASGPNVEVQIQNLCDELEAQEEQAEAVLKEVGLVSSMASPQVMEALSVDCNRLREAVSHTKDLIHLKREERNKGLIQVLKDGRQSFEGWFQDLQLSVNECFENPESKTDVEVYLQRLAAFLKSKDPDRRLDQLNDQLQRGSEQMPPEQQAEVIEWLKEQRGEVSTFRSHCQNRQQQMESLLSDLSSLQKQHDGFRDWLQSKEKQSVEVDKVSVLLKDLVEESGRAEGLGELLASVRRQGVRAEGLLKDSDNLIQRYRNLSSRLQEQAEAQSVLQGECDAFNSQAQSSRAWITELLKPLSDPDIQSEERSYRAQAVLSAKQEGDDKMDELRRQSEHLCEQETLETVQKQKIQQSVREAEEQWRSLLQGAEEALNKAQTEADAQEQVDRFKSQIEDVQTWIKDQKKKLMSTSSHMKFDDRIQIIKAVLSSKAEGESMVMGLQSRCSGLQLQESVRAELQRLLADAEQQWRTVLQAAAQAELRTLSDDFDSQSLNTQSWIRQKQQQLQTVGAQTPPEERSLAAQTILVSKPEGDCQVNNLRRRSQTLFDHTDADEGRKLHAQKTVRDTEETWRTVLMAAKHVEAAASAEISDRNEQKQLELRELDIHHQDINKWLSEQQQQVDRLDSQTEAEDMVKSAQVPDLTIMSCRSEGDAKLQEFKRRVQSVCDLDVDQPKKQELQQQMGRAEEQWRNIIQSTKQVLDGAERQCSLNHQLRDFKALSETTRTWLEDKEQCLETLDSHTDPEKAISDTQTILSCKPDGDSRVLDLRRHSQSLLEQPDLEETMKQQVHHTVEYSEEQWRRVLQSAEDNMKKAEVQYSLSRELEAFRNQAESTNAWVKELQQQAQSKGCGTQGSKIQIEERLRTAQSVLSCRSSGEAQVLDLKRRAKSLSENSSLDGDKRLEVQQAARDTEEQWRTVLEAAEDTQRQLTAVSELLQSCETRRFEAEQHLSDIKNQASSVPRLFPWPGLGERRQALEQTQVLLDRTAALAPVLSDIRNQAAELFEITQDESCRDPSWADKEESIPALLKELSGAVAELDQGILVERQCTQLVEQHQASQDWLREQVKGLPAPAEDRDGLHGTVNTLKALLLTVDREQRDMKELDSARDSLMDLCSSGGRDALGLEVSHLHDLCSASEQQLREQLTACETLLSRLDGRNQGLKERAAALQWELRSLDQALGHSEPQNNMDGLQQHWSSLQNCQKSLADLEVKVQDLHQEVKDLSGSEDLPSEIVLLADSLHQQHNSLTSRLSEAQDTCSANSARCLTEHLQALQEWSDSRPTGSSTSLQMTLEAGERFQLSLQEDLSHQQFLTETLKPELLQKLQEDASETLREAEAHRASLKDSLKDLEESSKDVAQDSAEDTLVMPPPRKKFSNEKTDQVPSTEKSGSSEDVSPPVPEDPPLMGESVGLAEDHMKSSSSEVPAEPIVVEEQSEPMKPPANPDEQQAAVSLMEQTESAEIKLIPTRRKSKNSGATSSLQKLQSDVDTEPDGLGPSVAEAVTEATVNLDDSQPPPITRSSVDSKLSSESASEEEAETEPEPGAEVAPLRPLQTESEARESKELPATTGDVSDPSTVVVKTDDPKIPTRKKSKSFEVSIVSELVSPFARDSDALSEGSVEPEKPPTTPESVDTQHEGAAEQNKPLPPKRKSKAADLPIKSDVEEHQKKEEPGAETLPSNSESVAEETKIVPTRRKSKNGQVPVISETLSPLRPDSVAPQPNKKDVNGQKSLNTGTAVTASLVEENKAKLSPTQRKPKGPKHTPEPATKDTGKSVKEAVRQHSLEKTEGKLTPVRRRSKVSLPVIDPETKDAGKESKSRSIPTTTQGSTLTSDTTAVTESKLSTITRKSQSPKVSPKPVKEEAKATEKQGKVGQVSETSAAEETQVVPTRRKSKETETFVEKGKLSPVKRKPKSLKPSKEVAKPDTQHQASSPKVTPDKAKSTILEKGKLSPTKRKSKTGKAQELSTTELSKMKETIKETPNVSESAAEEMVKLSPKERKSKGLKGSSQFPDKELVQTPEESDSQAVSSVSDVPETAATEENDGIGSVGLKESSDLSEAEMSNTTEESDAEKKLSSPEEATSDKITPEVPDTGFIQTKEEPGPQRPRSPEMVPTDVTEIKPHSEDWTPPSELSDQELNTGRDSDASYQKSSSAEDNESDGQELSSAQEMVETPKEPTTDHEIELLSEEAEGVTGEMEPEIDEIPEPSSEVSTTELTPNTEESDTQETCSPGVGAEESPEIRVPSVSKLLEEKVEATEDENIMSSSSPQPSVSLTPEDTSEVTLPKESDLEVSGQVDTADNMHLPEGAVTDEDKRQPQEAEEFPEPETPSPPHRNMDEAEASAAPGSVESLTPTVAEGPKSELEESSNSCVEEQDVTPLPENDLSRLSDEPSKDLRLSEYIDNLWKDTDKNEKRYLVLDVPEVSFSQTSDGAPDDRETSEQDAKKPNETLLENKEESSAEAETEEDMVEVQHRVPQELSAQMSSLFEAAHPNQETVEPVEMCLSEDVGSTEQFLTQIPTKEEIKEETPDTMDTVDVSAEQVYVEPEVRILQLDVPPDLEEETTTETGGKRADICIQREEDPEGQMIITADVTLQEPSSEKPEVKVQESTAEAADTGVQAASAEFIEINIYETSETETSKEPSEVTQISPVPGQEPEVREEPETLDHDDVKMEKIEKGSEVHISVQEESIMSVKITKEPTVDVNVSVECGKDLISDEVLPEMDTVEVTLFGVTTEDHDLHEQGPAEGSEQVSEAKITTADLQPELAPGEETGEEEQGDKGAQQYSGQSLTYLELQDEQETHTEVKDEAVSEVEVSLSDVCDAAEGLDEQEPGEESSIGLETVNKGKDFPDSTAVAGEPSESPAPSAPTETQETDAKEKTQHQEEEEEKEMNIPGQEKDTTEVEVVVETSSTLEEAEESPQEAGSPSDLTYVEDISNEGSGKAAVETDTGVEQESAVSSSFREILEAEPIIQLIQGVQKEVGPEAVMTASSDLENCRSRLVSKVLSCKNHPTKLEVAAMARQLQEAQACRDAAQSWLSSLSQARGDDTTDVLDHVEDKWSSVVQDAAAVVQQKEAELQTVTDYRQQTQTAETTLERRRMQLDAAQMSPGESSSEQRERLSSLQKQTEESRAALEQMFVAFDALASQLSLSERTTARDDIRDLQERWTSLERDLDTALNQAQLYSVETSNLLTSISNLQTNLDTICNDVEVKVLSDAQWSCSKAKDLMVVNAEAKAAREEYLQLQQLSDLLVLNSSWEKEIKEVQQGLQKVGDHLNHTEELVTSCMQRSSNPIMEKIIVVMMDGLTWAKQTECIIKGRQKKVALLPEEVHQQLRDLKKLQSEVIAKQGQLEALVEEVTELLPQLDQAEEVPVVNSTLELLQELSKSTTEKLTSAVRQVESGLQTREKLSEQMADLDSWVMTHLLSEASRRAEDNLSLTQGDRRSAQIQESLVEAEKQLTVCQALLKKLDEISPELSITENLKLFTKLTNLKKDIQAIKNYETANKKELSEHTQSIASSNERLLTIEKSLRQMLADVDRHRYPVTKESIQALEPFKHTILEHKSQIDLLQPWVPQETVKELYSVVSELLSKMAALEMNSRDHESYLSMRQYVEDLRENIEEQLRQTKQNGMDEKEQYKLCQNLILKIPLIKSLSEETRSKLQMISSNLYPSQLNAEQQRLTLHEESLETLETRLYNDLTIIERDALKDLDLDSEEKAALAFLQSSHKDLQRTPTMEPDEAVFQKEHQRIMTLKMMVESKMRALEFLKKKKGPGLEGELQTLMDLKNEVISECDSQMVNVSQARDLLRSYTCTVKEAALFLRDIEASLQPSQGSAGSCSDRMEETQRALHSLQQQFQTHVEQLQDQVISHPYLSPQKVQELQENILSHLLVKMSTLQAKGHIQLENLSRCAENNRRYTQCHEGILQNVENIEENLFQVIRQKLTSLADCTEQHLRFSSLSEELDAQLRSLEELRERCTEQSCYRRREDVLAALWRRLSRLRHCTRKLATRSKERISEWSEISTTVEKASVVLEQVEAELPDGAGVNASSEELQDLLQSWEQYQDRLDREQRALSALELRTARLLGVPAHLEQAPPTPLCQKVQVMQAGYSSVKKRSSEGLEEVRMEVEEREKIREELHSVQLQLEATDVLLTELEQGRSTQELQEVHHQLITQKALLQALMEKIKLKYSEVQSLVPVEIQTLLEEVQQPLQELEVKVVAAVDRCGPAPRLGVKLSEILTGLKSVQKKLEQRSSTVTQAEDTQKHVWDQLDLWHSRLAELEVEAQDLERPEDAAAVTEKLTEVQQLHSQLAKQAELRTALIGKIKPWLQEHQEMINSSDGWMSEARSWLAAPCTYTSARCLSSRVKALQRVLDDSAQVRSTLQGFSSVLKDMSQVCDVTALQEQLLGADSRVAEVQDRFTAPLSQLQHAATKVEAIEREVRQLEKDVAEIKALLVSPESCPSPRKQRFKMVEQRVQSMRTTVAEIQRCKPGLCLPGNTEETLTVFTVVNQLQNLLLDLEKKVPALFTQQPLNPAQSRVLKASSPPIPESSQEDTEKDQGQLTIAHVEEDVLKRSGAKLLTVQRSSPTTQEPEEPDAAGGQTGEPTQDIEKLPETAEAGPPGAPSEPSGPVRTQSRPDSMVKTDSVEQLSKPTSGAQQRCVIS